MSFQTDWMVVPESLRPTEEERMASTVTVDDLDLMNCARSAEIVGMASSC